jgi:hypothetical protein
MRVTRNNWWMFITESIIGFDEEGAGGTGEGGQGAGEGEGTGEEGAGEGQGSQGTGSEGEGASDDTAGLKSALQKERESRKALEKQLSAIQKAEQKKADAELSEVDRLKKENEAEKTRTTKLAQGFRKNAINQAVLKAAGAAKFIDPTDALRQEVLDAIGVEQDEDDPSQVTVDEASVTAAVKELAKTKKHFIQSEDGGQQQRQRQAPKSGSSFGGSGNQNKQTAEQQALVAKYPALRRVR